MDGAFDKIRKTVLRSSRASLSPFPAAAAAAASSSCPTSRPTPSRPCRFSDALSLARVARAAHLGIANWTKRDATAIHRPRLSSPRSPLSRFRGNVNLSLGNSLESGVRARAAVVTHGIAKTESTRCSPSLFQPLATYNADSPRVGSTRLFHLSDTSWRVLDSRAKAFLRSSFQRRDDDGPDGDSSRSDR